jgi:hypothetical protein
MISFMISPDGRSITCQSCHQTSHHSEDVRQHYCPFCHRFHDDVQMIDFYVIYERPRDYPDDYVLRRQSMIFVNGQRPEQVQDKACNVGPLAELRRLIPRHAVKIGRHPQDDPVILEVWMT